MISFRANTNALKQTLDKIKVLYKGKRLSTLKMTCELTMIDNLVTFAVPGAIFSMDCVTRGTAKATIAFNTLYSIMSHHNVDTITAEFYDGSLRFGIVQVRAKTIFFEDDRVLRTIRLSNNYTDIELMLLKNGDYTEEELEFNNLTGLITEAEKRIFSSIRAAGRHLNKYGITNVEIKKLVIERLKIKLDLDEKNIEELIKGC